MKKEVVVSDKIPKPIAPYSPGIKAGNFIFASGHVALDPLTGEIVGDTIAEQTEQALKNLRDVIEAAGSSLEHVVKTTVFLSDMNDFKEMNAVYGKFFQNNPPARSTVQVGLVLGFKVEIEAIAIIP
ncbi:Rid family detoxifying hydrolase [Candidatus Borrarchaeum sp.]|uniref:RidA family protein n=1 Tax=Candidatus Borrarchaeum sp. TaxID=2846742 RepID=UPI0025804E38|nr:Rid family detoxifying hydrolase [Candidatus Borrarchaeum sp.]